jgi:hypothetical protein
MAIGLEGEKRPAFGRKFTSGPRRSEGGEIAAISDVLMAGKFAGLCVDPSYPC